MIDMLFNLDKLVPLLFVFPLLCIDLNDISSRFAIKLFCIHSKVISLCWAKTKTGKLKKIKTDTIKILLIKRPLNFPTTDKTRLLLLWFFSKNGFYFKSRYSLGCCDDCPRKHPRFKNTDKLPIFKALYVILNRSAWCDFFFNSFAPEIFSEIRIYLLYTFFSISKRDLAFFHDGFVIVLPSESWSAASPPSSRGLKGTQFCNQLKNYILSI